MTAPPRPRQCCSTCKCYRSKEINWRRNDPENEKDLTENVPVARAISWVIQLKRAIVVSLEGLILSCVVIYRIWPIFLSYVRDYWQKPNRYNNDHQQFVTKLIWTFALRTLQTDPNSQYFFCFNLFINYQHCNPQDSRTPRQVVSPQPTGHPDVRLYKVPYHYSSTDWWPSSHREVENGSIFPLLSWTMVKSSESLLLMTPH